MFRFVLIDSLLNDKLENSLDNAFRSNIIPQLEGRPKWSLECIRSFCCEQITVFLQGRNVEQTNFGKYEQEFRKLIIFLGRDKIDYKLENYRKKQISENEWLNYDPWKGKQKRPSLPKFKKSITDLIDESEII